MFGLSDSFTSWAVRRALTARGAGVAGDRWTQNGWQQQQLDGGWRTLSRARAKPNHRRAECTMGRPADPPCSLRAWATREQRAPQQSAAPWLGIVSGSWEQTREIRSPFQEFLCHLNLTLAVWLVCVIVEGKGDGYQSVLLVVLLSKRADKVKWFGRLALPPALIAGVLEKAVLICVLRRCQGSGRGQWVSCRGCEYLVATTDKMTNLWCGIQQKSLVIP